MNEQSTQEPLALFHAKWLKKSLTIGAWEAGAELERLHEEVGRLTQALKQANDQTKPVHADESMWCRYIATMIGGYLGEPVGSDKEKAIAGIIERRLWNLPKKEAPAVAVNTKDQLNAARVESSILLRAMEHPTVLEIMAACAEIIDTESSAVLGADYDGTALLATAKRFLEQAKKIREIDPEIWEDCPVAGLTRPAPAVAVNEQMLTALKLAQFFVEELTNAAGKYAGLEGQVVADAYMVSAKLNIAIAAYEAAKKGGAE